MPSDEIKTEINDNFKNISEKNMSEDYSKEVDVKKSKIKIDDWIITQEKTKIIGCGEISIDLIEEMKINYSEKLSKLEIKVFNKPTKPDYLNLKLEPDYRNIRAASIKEGVERSSSSDNDLGSDKIDNGKTDYSNSQKIHKKSLLSKIKDVFSSRQKGEEVINAESLEEQKVEDIDSEQDLRDKQVARAKSELRTELEEFLLETDLLFIITDMTSFYGMDNSLSTAKFAKEKGIITVALVLLPETIEKLDEVESGNRDLQSLRLNSDIVFVIPQIEHVIEGYLVLIIYELMELMTSSGLVNLDVADVKNVVGDGNVAMLGFGAGKKPEQNKIIEAINEALTSPILNIDLDGVTRTLVNVTGDSSMTVSEAHRAAKMILERIQPGARLIWGAAINPKLKGAIKVMVMVGIKPKNMLVHIYANS